MSIRSGGSPRGEGRPASGPTAAEVGRDGRSSAKCGSTRSAKSSSERRMLGLGLTRVDVHDERVGAQRLVLADPLHARLGIADDAPCDQLLGGHLVARRQRPQLGVRVDGRRRVLVKVPLGDVVLPDVVGRPEGLRLARRHQHLALQAQRRPGHAEVLADRVEEPHLSLEARDRLALRRHHDADPVLGGEAHAVGRAGRDPGRRARLLVARRNRRYRDRTGNTCPRYE